jgi:hypothetical protein
MAVKTAGTWAVTEPAGIEPLTTFGTTQLHPLGKRCKAFDTGATAYGFGEFIYLEGCASTVRGSVVTINDNWLTALAVADAFGACAVALSINVASNYGWYQILGRGVASSATTIVDGAQAFSTAAGGVLDDGSGGAAGDMIQGMIISSTTDTATCIVTMTTYPFRGIRTVEQFCEVSDDGCHQIGHGYLTLRNAAQAWLRKAQDGSAATKLAAELQAKDSEIRALKNQVADILARIAEKDEAPAPKKSKQVQT